MYIEISVALAALAFIFLVIYLISLIRTLRVTLGQINLTLINARQHLDEISTEAKKTTFDVNYKMESLNSVFKAVSNIGDYLEQKTKSVKLEAEICALKNEAVAASRKGEKLTPNPMIDNVARILELVGQSFRLWQDVHKRR